MGCSTERREGDRASKKGRGGLFRERAIGRQKEEGDEGGKEVLKTMQNKIEKKESSSFIV